MYSAYPLTGFAGPQSTIFYIGRLLSLRKEGGHSKMEIESQNYLVMNGVTLYYFPSFFAHVAGIFLIQFGILNGLMILASLLSFLCCFVE